MPCGDNSGIIPLQIERHAGTLILNSAVNGCRQNRDTRQVTQVLDRPSTARLARHLSHFGVELGGGCLAQRWMRHIW